MNTVMEKCPVTEVVLEDRIDNLEAAIKKLQKQVPANQVSIIVLSGDFDKAMAPL